MSTQWDSKSSASFEQVAPGRHNAVCIRVIDLGTQEGEYQGQKTSRRQNLVTWELVDETREDGKKFIISKFYTSSISEKAKLYKDLTSWFGKAPKTPFDPTSLLGKPCELTVVEKNDKSVVDVVLQPHKSAKFPKETENSLVFFSLDDFEEDVFAELPEGVQKMIMKSPEYTEAINNSSGTESKDEDDNFDF